ncbi:MAG: hypothetical protein QOF76_2590 [Solirubrobacteraceae bacterium]|jgi:uncharacterized membrane protein|nr:hypothetical protein [Solirubrobacteraceae bacterium]
MPNPIALDIAHRIESVEALDAPAGLIGETVRGVLAPGPAKDALSGAWLGHALHPILTDLPIGTFTSAVLLDLFGGDSGTAADKLILFGLAATPGTIVTGWSDWADAEQRSPAVRRSGIAHALSNATAVGFMAASYGARKRGRRGRGKLLSLAGMTLMGAGGWLGGHLSYTLGAGVDAGAPAQGAQAQSA